jgi:hypothetical protein
MLENSSQKSTQCIILTYDWNFYYNKATEPFNACLSSLVHYYMKYVWDVAMLLWTVYKNLQEKLHASVP